jgi:hypothetical protein
VAKAPALMLAMIISSILLHFGALNAEPSNKRIFGRDKNLTYYYNPKITIMPSTTDIVWVGIDVKADNGTKATHLWKDILPEECHSTNLSDVEEIEAEVGLNCLRRTYWVSGGLVSYKKSYVLCEPPLRENPKPIEPGTAMENLWRLLCQEE